MAVGARTGEFATLLLIGATRRQVRSMVRIETMITLAFGLAAGSAVAIPGLALLEHSLDGSWMPAVPVWAALGLLGSYAALGMAATVFPFDRPCALQAQGALVIERRIVLAALALVAAYVADDAFVQPEAGVPASAHLSTAARSSPRSRCSARVPAGASRDEGDRRRARSAFRRPRRAVDGGYHGIEEGLGGDDLSGSRGACLCSLPVRRRRGRRLAVAPPDDGLPRLYAPGA